MKHNTKRYGKRRSSRRHRRGHRMMKGGFLQALSPSLYTDSANAIGGPQYERATIGDFGPLMTKFDTSPSMAMTNAIDTISPAIMESSQKGAMTIQNGGGRRQNNRQYQNQQQNQNQFQQQNQRQYQNQQQNQRGGVWNQMIGDAVAPLVLLGLQQYYGPRTKSNKGNKGKRTRRYRK